MKIDAAFRGNALRYLISGGVVTVLGTAALTILLKVMGYPLAYTIVFAASFLANMFLHSLFVFRRKLTGRVPLVGLTLVAQYFIGIGGLALLLDGLHVPRNIAPTCNLFICTPINFLLSRAAFHSQINLPALFTSQRNRVMPLITRFSSWLSRHKNTLALAALTVFIVALFTHNLLHGERIQQNDGIGWDGMSYVKWARMDSVDVLAGKSVSAYYISRLLPSFLVHNLAALFHYDIMTNVGVINAFYVYNAACLALALFLLLRIGKLSGWSGPTTLVAVTGMFFNYAVLKNASYNPTLTDMTALTFSLMTLYAWRRDSLWLYVVSSFLACFVWPSFAYSLLPILFFWRIKRPDIALPSPTERSVLWANMLAASVGIGMAGISLYLYFYRDFRLPAGTNPVNTHVLWLTVPLFIAYLFCMLRKLIDPVYAVHVMRRIDWRYATLAVALFAALKLVIRGVSNGEAGPLQPLMYIGLIAQGGLVNPLGNLVAHLSHYGPIVALAMFLLYRMQDTARRINPGMAFTFLLYGFLTMGSESRQFIPFLAILVFFAATELNKLRPDWFTAWVFVGISLALSRFWLTINVGEWHDEYLKFPEQMLFMYTGPWMSDQMYLVFLMISIIVVLAVAVALRALPAWHAARAVAHDEPRA